MGSVSDPGGDDVFNNTCIERLSNGTPPNNSCDAVARLIKQVDALMWKSCAPTNMTPLTLFLAYGVGLRLPCLPELGMKLTTFS